MVRPCANAVLWQSRLRSDPLWEQHRKTICVLSRFMREMLLHRKTSGHRSRRFTTPVGTTPWKWMPSQPLRAARTLRLSFGLHYFFATFRLEPPHLLERSLSTYSRLPLGEKFSASNVQRIMDEAKDLLKSEGYFETTITPHYDYDDGNHLVFVTLKAEPGPRARIGSIKLSGGSRPLNRKNSWMP